VKRKRCHWHLSISKVKQTSGGNDCDVLIKKMIGKLRGQFFRKNYGHDLDGQSVKILMKLYQG
jgi:hypothetical protein